MTPSPTARSGLAVASTGDTICAIGGYDADRNFLASVECLSQGAAAWVEVASLNTARYDHGAAAVGNVIFVVGGYGTYHTNRGSVGGILRSVELTKVKRGTFNGAMASLGKFGGQNKPPRLANGRDFAAALEKSNNA